MFDRKTYKSIAKKQLKGRWVTAFFATLIYLIILGAFSYSETQETQNLSNQVAEVIAGNTSIDFSNASQIIENPYFREHGTKTLLGSIIIWFVSGVLNLAYIYLFSVYSHTVQKQSFSVFIKGFSLWLPGFLSYLWNLLWTRLWGLLFVIPGIVKSYSYSLMFFILAEYPDVGVTKAMNLSKEMTRGKKADLFVLDLSFIGWFILCILSAGIGFLWLSPYIIMTKTNAYHAIKAEAIQRGIVKAEDFTE